MNTSGSSHDLIAAICHSIRIPALILIPPSAPARPGDVTMSRNIQQLIIQLYLTPHTRIATKRQGFHASKLKNKFGAILQHSFKFMNLLYELLPEG